MLIARPWWATNEQRWCRLCGEVATWARHVLDADRPLTESARELARLAADLHAQRDVDFATFESIRTETADFLVGSARARCQSDALFESDARRLAVEEGLKAQADAAAQNLLAKYAAA